RSLWFTKYKENELRASSVYNGVDLTDPVVDFATFSTDEALDEDVVMWVNVGFIHIPGNEDIPHTLSKGSQLGLILRPQNFFPQTPDGPTNAGYVFTTDCVPPDGTPASTNLRAIGMLLQPLKDLIELCVYLSGEDCEGS
ncbi:Amiloride-sensitive amine oxidase copper-containing, partial [Taenia solium]